MAVVAPVVDLDPEGTGFGDMRLLPDLATLRPLPWDPGTVLVLCDARLPDARPVRVAPRQVLRTRVEALAARGLLA